MSSELSTEIRKFEVRLQEFVKAEDEAIKSLTAFIGKVKELNKLLEAQLKENKPRKIENVMDLRFEIIKALQNALNRIAKAEHEKKPPSTIIRVNSSNHRRTNQNITKN
ncbi:MAG: hypothetical protein QXX51_08600 [Candidatus Bathyarchaeia archaeon]